MECEFKVTRCSFGRSVISGSNASLELSDNRSMTHSATLFKALTEGTHPASDFLGKYSNNGKGRSYLPVIE